MLTSKERFGRILKHQPVNRVGLFEVFWQETASQWAAAGHFERPEAVSDHFGLDVHRAGGEITPMTWKLLDLVGNLDAGQEVLEETETARLVRDGNGAVLRWPRTSPAHPSTSISPSATAAAGKSTSVRIWPTTATSNGGSTSTATGNSATNARGKIASSLPAWSRPST